MLFPSHRTASWTLNAGALALAALLSACGGGSDPAPVAANPPPVETPTPPAPKDDRLAVASVTVFGDSLSDVGTFQVATGDSANPGKFTVNPGNLWVDNIAAHYGLALAPNRSLTMDRDATYGVTSAVGTATVVGGNGYAEGGARVALRPSESGVGNNALVAPVSEQIDRYIDAHGNFPADQLVIVDGGGNDTYAQFSAVCWGTDDNNLGSGNTTGAIADAQIAAAAQAQVENVQKIKAHGAGLVLIAAASDWSSNPFAAHYLAEGYQKTGCYAPVTPAQVTAWTQQFNAILSAGVASLPGVVYMDAGDTFAKVLADPAANGFTNVTAPACTNTTPTNGAVFCTAKTLAEPDAAETYFWSDAFHPTPHGHRVLSDLALSLLDKVATTPTP